MVDENGMHTQQVKKTSGLAVAGLVLGIVGIVGSWIPFLNNVSFFIAALGFIFGLIALISVGRSHGAKGGKGLAIAAVIISLLACIIVYATQSIYSKAIEDVSNDFQEEVNSVVSKADGSATDELLQTDVSVDLGAFTATDKGGYFDTSLPVTVTNKASEQKSYSIQIECTDASGNRIDDDTVLVSSLGTNQTQNLEAFTLVTSDKVEALKAGTFKIVSVSQY